MKNKKINKEQVFEKFGVGPDKVIQIQALTGDKVDNIPGAPSIGPKTALQLIKDFGDVYSLIKPMANIIDQWYCGTINSDRGVNSKEIKTHMSSVVNSKNVHTFKSIPDACQSAISSLKSNDVINLIPFPA